MEMTGDPTLYLLGSAIGTFWLVLAAGLQLRRRLGKGRGQAR